MIRKNLIPVALTALFAVVLAFLGCSSSQTGNPGASAQTPPAKSASSPSAAAPLSPSTSSPEGEHAHKSGAHGGIIVSLGRDSYHVEAMFEKGGILRLYLLGNDETKVQEVDNQDLVGYVKPSDGNESISFAIKPQPQPGDSTGKTSAFVGELPAELVGRNLDVTIPSIRIAGERFRLGFTSAPTAHGDDAMPDKVSDDAERQLYLTAGGAYTEDDIKANGNMTASEKFKGFMAKHDLHPKPGDKICPVTLTKANPKCAWIVAGKTYEFCCPPCVDEFVKQAKESPDAIKQPEEYVQK